MKAGDVYSIPLFLTGVSGLESFYRYDFTKEGMTFCFARGIEDRGGSGLIIEVFNTQGGIDMSLSEIINSSRLFNLVAVAGEAIKKKRWRLMITKRKEIHIIVKSLFLLVLEIIARFGKEE
ncbi:Imm26 family immunity protein [Aeromonas sp. CD]|uniref:Imm26 family immunity protein n=1 Tax=Aeromonas sp. CD TaxID=3080830 RepID=UPI0029672D48|nr:Imm26 family immunity protein [Aeromonas sp. CD]WOX54284.1 Imm26 family immunity protein [Aeromonas sp. CD]